MGISRKDKAAFEEYKALCTIVKESTAPRLKETAREQEARINMLKKDYRAFFQYYFPHYSKSPCADYHVKEATKVKRNPFYKGIWEWYRGGAKSTHATVGLPIHLKEDGELSFLALAGETEPKACKLIGATQAELTENQLLKNDFGEQFSYGNWADGEFTTADGTSFYALGIGQSPRGLRSRAERPDFIIVDDADTKKRCKNPLLVREAAEWVMEDLLGCFGGERERLLICNNRIHKNTILTTIKEQLNGIHHSIVNALDKDGNPTWPERYSLEYWQEKQSFLSFRSFQREYMNNPIEEGSIFDYEWIRWEKLPPLHKYERIVAYCDPSFKNTKNSDFKAIKVWGKLGKELHLIKAFVRQCTVSTMVKWFYDLHESLPENVIVDYYIEANMLQDLLLDEFTAEGVFRKYQLPIRADKRGKPDKFMRIEATSPLYERGFIVYNAALKDDNDMKTAIDQLLAFEKGSNAPDDSPDADEGAIYMLQKLKTDDSFLPRIGSRPRPKQSY